MAQERRAGAVLLVTGNSTIALAVLRSLGRRGVPVYCALTAKSPTVERSRYCSGAMYLPQNRIAPEALIEFAGRLGATHLAAISEHHIVELNRHREALSERMSLLFPPAHIFERAWKKHITLEYAKMAGIPVPATIYPQRLEDARACRYWKFPVVVKLSHRDFPQGTKLAFQSKWLKLESYTELMELLGRLPPDQYPLIQEYIAGEGFAVSVLMRQGRVLLAFQHRRIREFPPQGGVSVYCESMPLDERLLSHSTRLLQLMEWEGVAMVEFRGNPSTKDYALMEVNGRFWGSLPLAVAAGAEFPYWLYHTSLASADVLPEPSYRTPVRCRTLTGDTKWLLAVLRDRPRSAFRALAAYFAAFKPSTCWYVWDPRDPMPAISSLLHRLSRLACPS